MNTEEMHERLDGIKLRNEQVFHVFVEKGILTNVGSAYHIVPRKESVEITTFYELDGRAMRFDNEVHLLEPLPSVTEWRNKVWDSLLQYLGVSFIV